MTELALMDGFSPPSRDQWLALVEKVLKGADFDRRLVARTADGIPVQPLYTRDDALAGTDRLAPGQAPLTRGTAAAPHGLGWDIRQLHAEVDPSRANAAILDDLEGGATSIKLQIASPGWTGLPATQDALAVALKGVMLDVCPIALEAGESVHAAARALIALWDAAGIPPERRSGAFNADPLGTLALTGALSQPLDAALADAAQLVVSTQAMAGVTALCADGHVYHAAGATEAQELAATLSSLVAYLRACEAAGLAPNAALPRIAVNLAVDADQFMGLAKLRAIRKLVWRVADACGAGDAAARVQFTAETALRMMARRDPWVNMLRTTMACATAAMGGAQAITVLPYTWALGQPDGFARRIARNTHVVLQEESGLGRVVDPAGGSWAVEKLTEELASKAWALFQEIEGKGGMVGALASGFIQERIATAAAERARLISMGRMELTGVSAFPKLGEDGVTAEPWPPAPAPSAANGGARVKALKVERAGAPFEALRDAADAHAAKTGTAPTVFLVCLGDLAVHGTRATWITNFLAAGGIAATRSEPIHASGEAGRAFAESGASIACICSADAVYAELGEATASALRGAGAQYVMLAGRPKDQEAALKAAGVDTMIYAGIDAIATLGQLHGLLGIGRG